MRPEARWVTLPSGLTLEVVEHGRGEAVLFLHGLTDSWRSFEPILPLLPEGIRALVPSQRGHGESDRPAGGYSIDQLAEDAAGLLDALGVDRAALVGHSMGSLVAQTLALDHPSRVRRMVLVDSGTTFETPDMRVFAQGVGELRDPVPRQVALDFQQSTIHRPIPEELLETFVGESLKVPAQVWQQALAGVLAFRSEGFLSRLGVPTLIVWGDHDAIVGRSEQERLRAGIRGSTLHVFEDTGHAPHWEQPQRFVDALLTFLGSERRAAPVGAPGP
jgi:non-heme chloroperoxidase